ncbi:MAG: SirB2 family protein [Gammaproteobacteria bacterium]
MRIFPRIANQVVFPKSSEVGAVSYLALRNIHIAAVGITLVLFVLRGVWMISGSSLLNTRFARVTPHIVDTILLASAIGLTLALQQYPLANDWLTGKVLGLVVYIGLGTIALKRGATRNLRIVSFAAALCVFSWIVLTAVGHKPYWPV